MCVHVAGCNMVQTVPHKDIQTPTGSSTTVDHHENKGDKKESNS